VKDELLANGLQKQDLGAHSDRKGGASFLSSGSVNGPSSTAVTLRVGWTMHGVEDRYLRWETSFVGV
jgi:hypothetical protein